MKYLYDNYDLTTKNSIGEYDGLKGVINKGKILRKIYKYYLSRCYKSIIQSYQARSYLTRERSQSNLVELLFINYHEFHHPKLVSWHRLREDKKG